MDISARWGVSGWGSSGWSIVEGNCWRIVYTVLAIVGCGESSVVEFTLGSVDVRGGRG